MSENVKLPSKPIALGGYRYNIHGPSADDAYFNAIHDNFEPSFFDVCGRVIKPEFVCLDIGANIGAKSLIMAQHATHGRIVSVEAAPKVYRALRANVEAYGNGRITTVHCAAGGEDGEVRFRDNSAYGHIYPDGVPVPMKRLSTILRETGVERFDFIKMDVEGFEEPILRDARDLIIANQAVVYFEFNAWAQMRLAERSPVDYSRWLVEAFTHLYVVRQQGFKAILERVLPDQWDRILAANLTEDGSVSDLVVTNHPERIAATASRDAEIAGLHDHIAALAAERDAYRARVAIAEASAEISKKEAEAAASALREARENVEALRGSRSWRVTAPLRALRGG